MVGCNVNVVLHAMNGCNVSTVVHDVVGCDVKVCYMVCDVIGCN